MGEDVVQLHRKINPGKYKKKRANTTGTLMLPNSKVFDAIMDCHEEPLVHTPAYSLHQLLMKKYFNITRSQCELYCKLCFVCQLAAPRIAPLIGAAKPIHSGNFRDRFQVDLIDMGNNPQKNAYSIEMKWIMTVKDNFTGFIAMAALPQKKAEFGVFELSNFFGILAFVISKYPSDSFDFLMNIHEIFAF